MQTYRRETQPPPKILTGNLAKDEGETLASFFNLEEVRQEQSPFRVGDFPKLDRSLADGLDDLFHGKCAFCESKAWTTPYRFRPPTEALPLERSTRSHLYYAWLAWAWENIYPICDACKPSQPSMFPVDGKRCPLPSAERVKQFADVGSGLWGTDQPQERALLLDPCSDTGWFRHLRVTTGGQMFANSRRGGATIRYFKLDRPGLVLNRSKRLNNYRERLLKTELPDEKLFDFSRLEFGGAWCLLLRQVAQRLASRVGSRNDTLVRIIRSLIRSNDGKARLDDELKRLDTDLSAGPVTHQRGPRPLHRPLRLISIKIRNFKALEVLHVKLPKRELTLTEKPMRVSGVPSLLVLGENAAGKTSLLEAVALALSDNAARNELELVPAELVLNVEFMAGREPTKRRSAVVELAFSDGAGQIQLSISRDGFKQRLPHNAALPPVFAYGAFRQYIREFRNYSPDKHIRSLFRGDFILSNPEKWLLSLDNVKFNLVIRTLRSILAVGQEAGTGEQPNVSDLGVIRRRDDSCFVVYDHPDTDGKMVQTMSPLSLVSSGYRSVLAMACDIMEGLMDPRVHPDFQSFEVARAVVLIDEIEAHLHPRWKIQVMRGLRLAFPNVTFIATTHDPLCIRGMGNGEVLVLRRVVSPTADKRTKLPVIVEHLTEFPRLEQLTVEQLLTSDLFQLLSTDAPEMEHSFARFGDLLTRRAAREELTAAELVELTKFQQDVTGSLPIGNSSFENIFNEAVRKFLSERHRLTAKRLDEFRVSTRDMIVKVLRTI